MRTPFIRSKGVALSTATEIVFERMRIDLVAREVWVRGERVDISDTEFDILVVMASKPGHAFTREELFLAVWRCSLVWKHETVVGQHIKRLRRAIEDNPYLPRWLVAVPGVGYRFDPDGVVPHVVITPVLPTGAPS